MSNTATAARIECNTNQCATKPWNVLLQFQGEWIWAGCFRTRAQAERRCAIEGVAG